MRESYDAHANTSGCYSLAVRCIREQKVRCGEYPPRNEDERRQASEGPVPTRRLDALKQKD